MLAVEIRPSADLARKIDFLKRQRDEVPGLLSQAVRISAFRVVENAKRLVPVSTGALRRSVKAYFYSDRISTAASIGSFLPYAARQEYDASLDHSVRPPRTRVVNTRAGNVGSVIKGTGQSNPEATWGFLRKSLAKEKPNFINSLWSIIRRFK
jgi:hypothetical protein